MQTNTRTLNSLIISIVLNILLIFLLTWFSRPKEKIEGAEGTVKVGMFQLPLKRQRYTSLPKRTFASSSPSHPRQVVAISRNKPTMRVDFTKSQKRSSYSVYTSADFSPTSNRDSTLPERTLQKSLSQGKLGVVAQSGSEWGRSSHSGVAPARRGSWMEEMRQEITSPHTRIMGEGREISGYYNISQVKYEDTADAVRTAALEHLAKAMNRWTKVKTKLLEDMIELDDKKLQAIPLVYIAANAAFAFSEKERENLRKYLYNGGFLLFSDISDERSADGPVANSIQFELWKILGSDYNLRHLTKSHPLNVVFFQFANLPIKDKNAKLWGISLKGRLSVLYDAAGLGLAWAKGGKGDEQILKLGVNIIAYALTTYND